VLDPVPDDDPDDVFIARARADFESLLATRGASQRMLSRLGDAAVAVFAADWQVIWWNRGWAALLGDPSSTPPALRNFARDTFPTDGEGPRLSQWPVTSLAGDTIEAAVVSDLRRATGRFPRARGS
jgi:PAS domain-containing protein